MGEDERHAIAMAQYSEEERRAYKSYGNSVFFTPVLAYEVRRINTDKRNEIARHQRIKRKIAEANPAPGFKYNHC